MQFNPSYTLLRMSLSLSLSLSSHSLIVNALLAFLPTALEMVSYFIIDCIDSIDFINRRAHRIVL